jgi:hypothetical protein
MLEENTPNALPLEPALTDAERLLRQSLTEACSMDPARADTGEMIRLEETLAIAGEAAKRAVSLRRRMRQEGRATPRAGKGSTRTRGEGTKAARPAVPADAPAPPTGAAPAPAIPGLADSPPAAGAGGHGHESEASLVSQAASEHRTFRDAHGVTWSVWAVHPQHSGTRRAGLRGTFVQGWLAFVSEAEKRRLSPVPDGWMELDDAALERMCAEAEVAKADAVTRRMPPIRSDEG